MEIDTNAIDAWLRQLDSPALAGRGQATCELAEMGPPIVPYLADFMRRARLDRRVSANVRRGVVIALGRMGVGAEDAIPELIEALRDDVDAVCAEAAVALGGMGETAHVAVPALARALRSSRGVDASISSAIALADVRTADALQALVDVLGDATAGKMARSDAAVAVGRMGARARSARTVLISAAKSADGVFKKRLDEALRQLGDAE